MPSVNEPPAALRGAMVGFGNAALHAHLPVWSRSPRFRIDAVVEPDPERAAIARDRLPAAGLYPSLEAMLAAVEPDFVDICTPPCSHPGLVLAALQAGAHVICEKPLATSTERLNEIRRSAERAGRVVFTVNNWKYAPLWLKAAELVRDNRIGAVQRVCLDVLRCSSSGGGASGWRTCAELSGGGILIDHGWHTLYLLLALFPGPPRSVAARLAAPPAAGEVEETADLLVRFEQAEARVHLTWQAPQRRNGGEIQGEFGTIRIGDDHLLLHARGAAAVRYEFAEALSAGSHHTEWMEPVVAEFEREIREPSRRGANLKEACWCARLIDSAYRSGRGSADPVAIEGVP
jgi:predicted dehydrogenase